MVRATESDAGGGTYSMDRLAHQSVQKETFAADFESWTSGKLLRVAARRYGVKPYHENLANWPNRDGGNR